MTKIQNPFTSKPESPIHSFASNNTHTTRTLYITYIYIISKPKPRAAPIKTTSSYTAQQHRKDIITRVNGLKIKLDYVLEWKDSTACQTMFTHVNLCIIPK